MTRPAFGGNIMATIICPEFRPQMATVRPGVMQRIHPAAESSAKVENYKVELPRESFNVEILDIVKKVSDKMDIQDAKILVSGGRGMGCPENFQLLEDLAAAFGGGATVSSFPRVRGRGVGREGQAGRPDGQDGPSGSLHCMRYIRSHPASCGHGGFGPLSLPLIRMNTRLFLRRRIMASWAM